MKTVGLLCAIFTAVGFAQTPPEVCPKHVEPPVYPEIARTARMQGRVPVRVTIDAEGRISNAEVSSSDPAPKFLQQSAMANAKVWTFRKPPYAPYTFVITYEYRLRESPREVLGVSFDLPDHVLIVSDPPYINTSVSGTKKRN